jgi:hypothetical protein
MGKPKYRTFCRFSRPLSDINTARVCLGLPNVWNCDSSVHHSWLPQFAVRSPKFLHLYPTVSLCISNLLYFHDASLSLHTCRIGSFVHFLHSIAIIEYDGACEWCVYPCHIGASRKNRSIYVKAFSRIIIYSLWQTSPAVSPWRWTPYSRSSS